MKEAIVIIGGQYGDEGKGLLTSYYCKKHKDENPLVIRYSGSAQAGHTVVYNGIRHVFSHFGSGTLQGVPTHLSREFVCHPMLFRKEREKLLEKGIHPIIGVDPNCEITTPFDMFYNQFIEDSRGTKRHGSCGVGFGCTVDRAEHISFTVNDGLDKDKAEGILLSILEYYCKLAYQFSQDVRLDYLSRIRNISIDRFLEDLEYFYSHIGYINNLLDFPYNLNRNKLILESSQGLLLDPKYGKFPHVTRKSIGALEAFQVINALPDDYVVSVNYLTRPYITRHGNGPLEGEDDAIGQIFNITDETNVHNKYQGSVRYAPFNMDKFNENISKDYLTIANRRRYTKLVKVMTCVDQITEEEKTLIYDIENEFNIISRGPSFSDVEEM